MAVTGNGRLRGAVGWLSFAAILFVAGSGVAAARADDSDAQQAPRTVRLSLVEGHVQLTQNGQAVSDEALANTPLFEGAQITTADDARAEIQFDDGSVVRVPPASSVALTALRQEETEVTLNNGIGYFELQGGNSSFKVKFDDTVAMASGFTVLRVKMDNPPGNVAVFSGNAHLEGQGTQADVRGGESVTLDSSAGGQLAVAENIEPDSWDAWNSDRDQALQSSESAPPPDQNAPEKNNPAWGDLNQNGTWYSVPDEGYVWSPYEASNAGWDPYGVGYWMWTPGYGYVWISGYSWGYMPYQCGYWNWYDRFGWGWSPGGCQTWWIGLDGGYGGWNFNVHNPPRWYRLPVRPGPPRPRNPNPKQIVRAVGPQPVIPVIREPQHGGPHSLPPRNRETPVLLGGTTVQPLRPVSRPVYRPQPVGRTGASFSGRDTAPAGGSRPGYVRTFEGNGASHPAPIYQPAPVTRAPYEAPRSGSDRQMPRYTPPAPMPPSGGSHPAPAPVSHPAPSGGGGHASAPSGGGGGHVSAPSSSSTSSSHK